MINKLKPSIGLVLVEIMRETTNTTPTGIILNRNIDPKCMQGRVHRLGDGIYVDNKLIPYSVKEGDIILFDIFRQIDVNLGAEYKDKYCMIHESDVYGIISN
jgi:co-chaperonin GroES (HSP10)